jgi:hypothetical protein
VKFHWESPLPLHDEVPEGIDQGYDLLYASADTDIAATNTTSATERHTNLFLLNVFAI